MKKPFNQKQYREFLKIELNTKEKWAIKALLLISGNQTPEEQETSISIYKDNSGFNKLDAEKLNYLTQQYLKFGFLKFYQLQTVFRRIPKYWKQVLQASNKEKLHRRMNDGKQLKLF